jgi:hypothetical protein
MTAAELLRALRTLGMEIREGRDTLAYFRWQGRLVLFTRVPHKSGELRGQLPHFLRQQLKLNESQLRDLLACPFGRDEFIAVLKQKGLIPPE